MSRRRRNRSSDSPFLDFVEAIPERYYWYALLFAIGLALVPWALCAVAGPLIRHLPWLLVDDGSADRAVFSRPVFLTEWYKFLGALLTVATGAWVALNVERARLRSREKRELIGYAESLAKARRALEEMLRTNDLPDELETFELNRDLFEETWSLAAQAHRGSIVIQAGHSTEADLLRNAIQAMRSVLYTPTRGTLADESTLSGMISKLRQLEEVLR